MAKETYRYDTLELCARAGEILKRVGFVHHQTSLKTEAAYYKWPGRRELLRIAAHSRKKPCFGLDPVAAKITFSGNCLDPPGNIRMANGVFERMLAGAIGRYFLKVFAP
jgi:hypothetical protein